MQSRYIIIILLASLASSSFTAAFMIFNASMFQQKTAAKSDSKKENVDEIRKLKEQLAIALEKQDAIAKSINSMMEDIQEVERRLPEEKFPNDTGSVNDSDVAIQSKKAVAANSSKTNPKQKALPVPAAADIANGRHAYLIREFRAEDRDESWGSSAMLVVMKGLSKPVILDSDIVALDCRSTFCRLQFRHKNKSKAREFIERFGNALSWTNATVEVFFTEGDSVISDIFMFKGGQF